MTSTFLTILQIVSGTLLIVAVLLQQKGAGMGAAFGGSSNIYSTKRGVDKLLFRATIVISIVFFGLGLLSTLL